VSIQEEDRVLNTVAIVDALSTGNELAKKFMESGYRVVHVWNDFTRQTRVSGFVETIKYEGSCEQIVSRLRKYDIRYVIAGSDSGIELADMLASMMGIVEGNSPETTAWRRNKYHSHQVLAENGLRSIKQFKSSSAEALVNWANECCGYPVIVKPLNSGASDGVTLCENAKEVAQAAAKQLGQKNLLGYVNEELLIQELVDGVQYFVNTLSWNGKHHVTDIWEQIRSRVNGGAYNFEGMHLIPGDEPTAHLLSSYACDVLSALGVNYGAAHNEIILTSEGPVLIEANARLMGASINEESFTRCLGYTQVSRCVEMYLEPGRFLNELVGKDYRLLSGVSEVSFLFTGDGLLAGMPAREAIENLPSFSNFFGLPTLGQQVKKTTDTKGLPGFVYLVNDNKTQLEQDFQQILTWQSEGKIFDIIS